MNTPWGEWAIVVCEWGRFGSDEEGKAVSGAGGESM